MGMFTGYKKTASVRSQKRSGLRVSFAFFCVRLSALNANIPPSAYVEGDTSAVIQNVERYEALIVYGTLGGVGTTIFGIMLNSGNASLHDICGETVTSGITATYDSNTKDLTLSFRDHSSFRVLYYRQI